ncbi:MAG: hypothetical protein ACC657_07120 [Thiohalomonadales bacterium]
MKKINYFRLIIGLFFPLLLVSCAATSITGTWKDENYNKPIEKILIIGLSSEAAHRRKFEDSLSEKIRKAGKKAVISVKYFTNINKINKESLEPIIEKEKVDTVIIVRAVSVDKENRYMPGSYPSMYGSMYGYYGAVSPYYQRKSYYSQTTKISLEINLYETKNAKLVWALATQTYEPGKLSKEIQKLAAIIANELKKDKLL